MLKKAVTFDRQHILSGRTVNHTMHDKPEPPVRRLHADLDGWLDGYPRMDPASRALWSTDASIHLRKPAGIVAARPSSCLYSPECVEEEFSEVHIRDVE